jgi:hypothetical protein
LCPRRCPAGGACKIRPETTPPSRAVGPRLRAAGGCLLVREHYPGVSGGDQARSCPPPLADGIADRRGPTAGISGARGRQHCAGTSRSPVRCRTSQTAPQQPFVKVGPNGRSAPSRSLACGLSKSRRGLRARVRRRFRDRSARARRRPKESCRPRRDAHRRNVSQRRVGLRG